MDFDNQRDVVLLRMMKLPWAEIRKRVRNRLKKMPSEKQCRDVNKRFNKKIGHAPYKYKNCGRKVWKLTKAVEKFLLKTLRAQRCKVICTSTSLQEAAAKEMNVELECSTIRKCLARNGYHWMPRSQKPCFSRADMTLRWAFVKRVLRMTKVELANLMKSMMAMDGVVLATPPENPTERLNFCKIGETHMWRKKDEAAKKELAGKSEYDKQIAKKRQVPMWGGVGPSGFGLVMFHTRRKVNNGEWSKAVREGSLVKALRDACAPRRNGPWTVLCDNESFLDAPASEAAHKRARVEVWHIPPRSPDLNPVEKYWAWVRKQLRAMDLADLQAKPPRPPVTKAGLQARVRALLRTRKAKDVASRIHTRGPWLLCPLPVGLFCRRMCCTLRSLVGVSVACGLFVCRRSVAVGVLLHAGRVLDCCPGTFYGFRKVCVEVDKEEGAASRG